MPPVPLLPLAVIAAAVGGTVLLVKTAAHRDHKPAPDGMTQLEGRVPVGLWPPDGSEPMVESGIRGWRRMADHLHHRDTVIDDAARARTIVLSQYSRRAADARREVAFEVSVLSGAYDPAVVAAAWLSPQVQGAEAGAERRAFRNFGLSGEAIAILKAVEALGDDAGRLAPEWGRLVGLDAARPDFSAVDTTELDADGRARLAALMIDAARERIHARG